jgi:hypothetical protein
MVEIMARHLIFPSRKWIHNMNKNQTIKHIHEKVTFHFFFIIVICIIGSYVVNNMGPMSQTNGCKKTIKKFKKINQSPQIPHPNKIQKK